MGRVFGFLLCLSTSRVVPWKGEMTVLQYYGITVLQYYGITTSRQRFLTRKVLVRRSADFYFGTISVTLALRIEADRLTGCLASLPWQSRQQKKQTEEAGCESKRQR